MAAAMLGCGSSPGGSPDGGSGGSGYADGACPGVNNPPGCVEFLNFNSLSVYIVASGASYGPGNQVLSGVKRHTTVPTALGSTSTWQAIVNSTVIGHVTCTVTNVGWVSVSPAVVFQPNALLTCSDF